AAARQCRDPSARASAGPLRAARSAAAGTLCGRERHLGARMSRHQSAEEPMTEAERIPSQAGAALDTGSAERNGVTAQAADAAATAPGGEAGTALPTLPPDVLIIVPVRDTVLFPGTVFPISIGREPS